MNDKIDYDAEYKKDSLSPLDLPGEGIKCHDLHAKYLSWYRVERRKHDHLKRQMDKLSKEKYELYCHGASKETKAKGWDVPQAKILKTDIPMYIRGDKDILALQEQFDEAKMNMETLDRMVETIRFRGKLLETIIRIRIFLEGG